MRKFAFAALAATVAFAAPAAAQTKYYSRATIPMGPAAVAAPVSKTLTCGSLTNGTTTNPDIDVQGPLGTVTSFAAGLAACNTTGQKYGTAYAAYNYCRVQNNGDGTFYPYLVKATGTYVYPTGNAVGAAVSIATCTYNP